MMKRSKVIGFAILAAAVGGALLVMSRGSSRDAHPRAPAAALSPPHLRRSPFTIPQLYAEGQAKAGGQAVKPDQFGKVRKSIARLKTIAREAQLKSAGVSK